MWQSKSVIKAFCAKMLPEYINLRFAQIILYEIAFFVVFCLKLKKQ